MGTLEQAISSALLAAKQLERAYYDNGPWSIRVNGVSYPATRLIQDSKVVFVATVQSETPGEHTMALLCRDDIVAVKDAYLSSEYSQCSWHIAAPQEEARV